MRVLFGFLGAVVGAILGLASVVFIAHLMSDGDDFGMAMTVAVAGWVGLLIGIAAGVPLALWVQRYLWQTAPVGTSRIKKLCLVVSLVISLPALLVGLLWAPMRSDNPPSDEQLLTNFRQHEAAFNRLAQMVRADKRMKLDDQNWTYPTHPETVGVTPAEKAQYRQLLDTVKVQTLRVSKGDSATSGQEIQFLFWGQGSAISSDTDKGYEYLATPPAKVVKSLDDCEPDRQNESLYYRHIEGNWYLYYEYLPG